MTNHDLIKERARENETPFFEGLLSPGFSSKLAIEAIFEKMDALADEVRSTREREFEFKAIEGFEDWAVNRYGTVINTRFGRVLKNHLDTSGYEFVRLGTNHVARVHRLVAEAFISKPRVKMQVNHKDGDKTNNHVDNLEWCTHQENMDHAYRTGLISYPETSCIECGKSFTPVNKQHKRCGSMSDRTGCSYAVKQAYRPKSKELAALRSSTGSGEHDKYYCTDERCACMDAREMLDCKCHKTSEYTYCLTCGKNNELHIDAIQDGRLECKCPCHQSSPATKNDA